MIRTAISALVVFCLAILAACGDDAPKTYDFATLERNSRPALVVIRTMNDALYDPSAPHPFKVTLQDGKLTVSGWTFDVNAGKPAAAVSVAVDGKDTFARYGLESPAPVKTYNNPALAKCGFSVDLPLVPGTYSLAVKVVAADGKSYAVSRDVAVIVGK